MPADRPDAQIRELSDRAYGDAWFCRSCESEFPDDQAIQPALSREPRNRRLGRCPLCGSVNVLRPEGRVRMAIRAAGI